MQNKMNTPQTGRNNSSYRSSVSHIDLNEDNIRTTIFTRAKFLLSSNCISLGNFALINSVTPKQNTADYSRSRDRNQKNIVLDYRHNRSNESSNDNSNVIQNQPNREAPYYYGDIIRTRKLDASTIFPQTCSKSPRSTAQCSGNQCRELLSRLKSDNNRRQATASVETVIVDRKHLSSPKSSSIVRSHIMDGIRVQLKNAGTRLKGSTAATPQKFKHHQVIRSQESHVSLRGWLYRLEGGGLKQWKRRWCVLADYCLFYYKDMAEQKLLGSALLPSFKINPCLSGDGISRKYSFKIEHSNMKTYYFAADTKEIQQQWMSALSMASIMQLSIFQTQKRPVISHQNSPDNKGTDGVPEDGTEIDKMRMMPAPFGEQCGARALLSRNNVGSASNGAKLLYAPDGYPLSNMIDDQARDVFVSELPSNGAKNSAESAIKYTDEVNGLPSLCHPQVAPATRQHYAQQISNHFDVTTASLPNTFHGQVPYQSSYQFMAPYQYSDGNGFPMSQQPINVGHGVYGQTNGIVPPPKPRRAPVQQYYSEQQYYPAQNGAIMFDNYGAFEYSAPLYPLAQSSQTHPHLSRSVFYSEMPTNRSHLQPFMPSTYIEYPGPIVGINPDLDRPKRPHSADFLERSEDDLDCEVAFHDQSSGDFSIGKNADATGNGHNGSVKHQLPIQPKILPTRPKSSFARYNDRDVGVELYDFPLNLPTSGRLNELSFVSQNNGTGLQHYTSDDENRLNEFAEHQQNHLTQQLFAQPPLPKYQRPPECSNPADQSIASYITSPQHSPFIQEPETGIHPPYQHHYQLVKNQLNGTNPQLIPSPNRPPPTSHNSTHLAGQIALSSAHLSVPHLNAPLAHPLTQNPSRSGEQLIEPHRDELYKASQLFYRRTSSIISDSAVGASTQSSLYNVHTANGDWSESGLPTTPATASQDSLIDSASRSGEERDAISLKIDKNILLNGSVKKFENHLKNNLNNIVANNNNNNNLNSPKVKHHLLNDINNANNANHNNNNDNNNKSNANIHSNNEHSINSDPLKSLEQIDNNGANLSLTQTKLNGRNLLLGTGCKLVDQGVFDLNINDSEELDVCEENNSSAMNSAAKDIRFKLGQKVRTYRKPRPSSSSSTASSSLPNEMHSQALSKADPQAPYYITDLLSEQQRRDLQKKLPSNPLPPLLSRSTVDSARQAGTTTLSLKNHTKNQDSIDSTLSSDQYILPVPNSYSLPNSVPLPLPSRISLKSENKSLDDYFGTFDSSDSDSSIGNIPVSGSELEGRRKKRTKRRSKMSQIDSTTDKNDNASDSELHNRLRQRNRKSSNQRMYASAGDFIGKSRDELSVMLENYRRQQSRLSTSYDALKIAMESEAKLAELNPCKAPEYQSRIEEFQRQLDETQECVARKQPIIDRIDSLIRVSETPDHSKSDKDDNKKDNAKNKNPEKDDNIENLKRQQNILAVELDRVRGLLTHSTRALEAKAVENAKMEAEMQAARKKLKQVLENDKAEAEISRSEKLERELAHINQVIDNLHSRRQELNSAIENLKYPSNGSEDMNSEKMIATENDSPTQPIVQNGKKTEESNFPSASDSTSGSEESSANSDNPEHSKMLEQKYRAFLAANTPLIPLYENLGSNATVIPSFLSSQQHSLFPVQLEPLNNDQDTNDKRTEQDDDENDEFFTLNLPKDVQLISSMQSQLQGCEFNPQAYHQMGSVSGSGNANMDEHLQQILAFQQQQQQQGYYQQQQQQQQQQLSQSQFLSQKTEIRTVREVKREAERRKHHQAQSAKINALIRSLPGADGQNGNIGAYSQMSSHHFYMEEEQFKADSAEFVNDNITKESPITAPDLIQSTIH